MAFSSIRVYPILDSSVIPQAGRDEFLRSLGQSLADAGVDLLEYRNKTGSDEELASDAEILRRTMHATKLILDDRADLVIQVGFDGVHVDAADVSVLEAGRILGPDRISGPFAGRDSVIPGILPHPADCFAIGPVFTTTTKHTDKP